MREPHTVVHQLCQRFNAVILHLDERVLRVAVADTIPEEMSETLRFACQRLIEVECWPQARLDQLQQQNHTTNDAVSEAHGETASTALDQLLRLAIQRRASDIHLEPQTNGLRIRLRIDGVLQGVARMPEVSPCGLLARLKVLAGLDIAERRLPQDGQFTREWISKPPPFALRPSRSWGAKKR